MPELPEVEILKRELESTILGRTISHLSKSSKRLRRIIPELSLALLGENILNIYRRNKYIIIETTNNWLVIHLGMTGKIIYSSKKLSLPHIHLSIQFSDGSYLEYDDPRRFGSMDLFTKKDYFSYFDIPLFNNLGIEPLGSDYTISKFKPLFTSSKTIKNFLMDSSFVCGIGNIYASEILFLSNILPTRRVNTITEKEKEKLFKIIPKVLEKSISLGGSSISDYVHTNGVKGEMQNFYYVYGRANQECKICNNPIEKIVQNGRSTFYCNHCQK